MSAGEKQKTTLAHCPRRVLPKDGRGPLTSSCLHTPHQQQARPQSPDLIWMIKTFFFSTNFSPPPSPLLLSASLAPSPIDHHTEEITLIAGITSPHVGYTQGEEEGDMSGMMCKCVMKEGVQEMQNLGCPTDLIGPVSYTF